MPIRRTPKRDIEYLLIRYDENGVEVPENDAAGTMLSRIAIHRVADPNEAITDVFFTSHGWKGDVPEAISQYDSWIDAMADVESDRAYVLKRDPKFKSLVIGLHWPSLPFGDENLPSGERKNPTLDDEVESYACRIADTSTARTAIRSILETATVAKDGATLPSAMKSAYATLFAESGLGKGDVGSAPGSDQQGWDPQLIVDEEKADDRAEDVKPATGGGLLGSVKDLLLSPLRQASFWKMKARACSFGESGAHTLLLELQRSAPATTRFHLMGHSFGCIVASATVAGGATGQPLVRRVDSLFLVQGALSIWAYSPDIPYAPGTPGYFSKIVANKLVRGPMITTQSKFDRAVGVYYPRGAEIKKQFVLVDTPFPKYAGVGTFGIQGMKTGPENQKIRTATSPYGFKPGMMYNIESSRVIRTGDWISGAHSDIAHPDVAHILWEAVLATF